MDNGQNSQWAHQDNYMSSSRLNATGTPSLTAGGTIEFEISTDPSDSFDIADSSAPTKFRERKVEVFLDHKNFGKLTLGQGPVSGDSTSEIDYSSTTVANYSQIDFIGGGIRFFNTRTNAKDSRTVGQALIIWTGHLDRTGSDMTHPNSGAFRCPPPMPIVTSAA